MTTADHHPRPDASRAAGTLVMPRPHPGPSGGSRRGLGLGRTERLMRVRLLPGTHGTPDPTGMPTTAPGAAGAARDARAVRTGTMGTGPWVLDPDGRPFGAAGAVVMDNTLAMALHAAEPRLQWIVTTELSLEVLRPLPADGTVLESWTRPRVADGLGGMATGTLRGADGTEYLRASGWFQGVERHDPAAVERFTARAALPLGPDTEVPLHRILGASGTTPAPPPGRPEVTDGFGAGWGFDRTDELHNPHGAVHGGAMAMMAALAAQRSMGDRAGFDLQSLRTMFLRPATGAITSRVRLRHAGRSLRIVQVELAGAPGAKPFVQAEAVFRPAR